MDRSQNPSRRATLNSECMRDELKLGATDGYQGGSTGIVMLSLWRVRTSPHSPNPIRPAIYVITSAGFELVRRAGDASSLITNYHPALSAVDCLWRPERFRREGSQITAFLIDTLPIRNTAKSFAPSVGARSNRHSSEPRKPYQIRAAAPARCDHFETMSPGRNAAHR